MLYFFEMGILYLVRWDTSCNKTRLWPEAHRSIPGQGTFRGRGDILQLLFLNVP